MAQTPSLVAETPTHDLTNGLYLLKSRDQNLFLGEMLPKRGGGAGHGHAVDGGAQVLGLPQNIVALPPGAGAPEVRQLPALLVHSSLHNRFPRGYVSHHSPFAVAPPQTRRWPLDPLERRVRGVPARGPGVRAADALQPRLWVEDRGPPAYRAACVYVSLLIRISVLLLSVWHLLSNHRPSSVLISTRRSTSMSRTGGESGGGVSRRV